MDKAIGAYRTISEVADELDIPQHVLRFWETRFPQIKPMKRSGGRRYYRPGDVLLLRGIRRLLYGEGYTIKGVQRILAVQGLGVVQQAGGASGDELAAADIEGIDDLDVASPPIDEEISVEYVPQREAMDEGAIAGETMPAASAKSGSDAVTVGHQAAAPPPPALSSNQRRLLQSVLDELLECARHLDSLGEAESARQTLPGEH
ncbi:MAG: MerR family transcriptional regulator [Hyphomicrobiales bacterium]